MTLGIPDGGGGAGVPCRVPEQGSPSLLLQPVHEYECSDLKFLNKIWKEAWF